MSHPDQYGPPVAVGGIGLAEPIRNGCSPPNASRMYPPVPSGTMAIPRARSLGKLGPSEIGLGFLPPTPTGVATPEPCTTYPPAYGRMVLVAHGPVPPEPIARTRTLTVVLFVRPVSVRLAAVNGR